MDGDDAGVVELGKGFGFAGEPFGKGRVPPDVRRQNFQRDDAVQFFLPGFIDCAHAALADKSQNFELREMGDEFCNRGRDKAGWLSAGVRSRGKRAFHQALGTETFGRVR